MPTNSMAYWQNHGLRPGTWCFGGGALSPPLSTPLAPTHDGMSRLSWLGWLVTYRDGLPTYTGSPI